jgi:hypothetical protein
MHPIFYDYIYKAIKRDFIKCLSETEIFFRALASGVFQRLVFVFDHRVTNYPVLEI